MDTQTEPRVRKPFALPTETPISAETGLGGGYKNFKIQLRDLSLIANHID